MTCSGCVVTLIQSSAADDPSVSQSVFTITEKLPTRAFSWLRALSLLRREIWSLMQLLIKDGSRGLNHDRTTSAINRLQL